MTGILVIGGGFAGVSAAVVAADEIRAHNVEAQVTLVSETDQMTIRPRLYEKNPETLRAPIRPALDAAGIAFVEGAVATIDTNARSVMLKDGVSLS
jgi:NADH dehydrogenase